MDKLKIEALIPASADRIYKDWLSSEGHTNMTGGEANISDEPTAKFTAGYQGSQILSRSQMMHMMCCRESYKSFMTGHRN